MLSTFWGRILSAGTPCAICGAFPVHQETRLCRHCFERSRGWFSKREDSKVSAQAREIFETQFDFAEMKFGFLWAPDQARAKVHLLHDLKIGDNSETWSILSERFLQAHPDLNGPPTLLLPLPGRKKRVQDHAWQWARALAPGVGGHVLSVFCRKDLISQKHLGKAARSDLTINLKRPELKKWLQNQSLKGFRLILVDDVVTTGSTAKAAWKALGQPKGLELWALAHRITLRNQAHFGYNAVDKLSGIPRFWV